VNGLLRDAYRMGVVVSVILALGRHVMPTEAAAAAATGLNVVRFDVALSLCHRSLHRTIAIPLSQVPITLVFGDICGDARRVGVISL